MKRSFAVTAALVASLASALPAQADASGQIGSYEEAGVTCYLDPPRPQNNRVIVQGPHMSSSPVPAGSIFIVGGGWFGGGFHVQKVGYQAFLYKWNGQTWVWTQTGPVFRGQTADALQPVLWSDGIWGGSTVFSTPGRGHYLVYMRYFWFADAQTGAGSAEGFARVYEQGRLSYCSF
jgi:hypothetical protein